jgi:hypothetical protein
MTALCAEINGKIFQKEWVKTGGKLEIINLQGKNVRWRRQ